jgi:hypothetical protein
MFVLKATTQAGFDLATHISSVETIPQDHAASQGTK